MRGTAPLPFVISAAFAWLGICSAGHPPTDDARSQGPGGGRGWQTMADMFKCPKCGKTSPKFTNCCGTPMKKNG